jgi:hypothetical protein
MLKSLAGLALLVSATGASAASQPTNFGIRSLSGPESDARSNEVVPMRPLMARSAIDLRSVASLGSQWGRVTSTYRSPAHNRRVGGVRNSFHLSGRAIDIARRPGVTHGQIAAAYRTAGYYLIESLDEGDHSHFAFGSAPRRSTPMTRPTEQAASSGTKWRIVTAASAVFK